MMSDNLAYLLINPTDRTVSLEHDTTKMQSRVFGKQGVDFGMVGNGLQIMVWEHGLLQEDAIHYFAIGKQLFAGRAIVFAYDEAGETVSLSTHLLTSFPIRFFMNMKEVEGAIATREIDRPYAAINGEVIWQWPSPKHPYLGSAK